MECSSCDSKKPMKAETIVHKFRESGLDNVTLHGVKHYRCSNCGESYYDFGDVNQLNAVIADALLRKKGNLTGQEIRFLRTYVGYSSEMFSKIIGMDKTSISRIENGRARVSNQVNMAVRFAVAGRLADRNYDIHDFYEAIEKENLINFKSAEFKTSAKGWHRQMKPSSQKH